MELEFNEAPESAVVENLGRHVLVQKVVPVVLREFLLAGVWKEKVMLRRTEIVICEPQVTTLYMRVCPSVCPSVDRKGFIFSKLKVLYPTMNLIFLYVFVIIHMSDYCGAIFLVNSVNQQLNKQIDE